MYVADYEVPEEATHNIISVADSMVIGTEPSTELRPFLKRFTALQGDEGLPQNHGARIIPSVTRNTASYVKLVFQFVKKGINHGSQKVW